MYSDEIKLRVFKEAEYMIKSGDTLRGASAVFGLGKSTVHSDMTEKLKNLDFGLYKSVRKVICKNLSERHIRGGNATKRKYVEIKNMKKRSVLK